MAQFHRLQDAIHNQGRTETCTQAQEEHLAAFVAPQSLHGGIVDELYRSPERSLKVKPDPTGRQVMWFGNRPVLDNWPGIANRNRVILPFSGELLYAGDHLRRRHLSTRRKLPWRSLRSGKDLHV